MPDFQSALQALRKDRNDETAAPLSSTKPIKAPKPFEERKLVRKDTAAMVAAAAVTPLPAFGSTPRVGGTARNAHGTLDLASADTVKEVDEDDSEDFPSLDVEQSPIRDASGPRPKMQTAQSLFAAPAEDLVPESHGTAKTISESESIADTGSNIVRESTEKVKAVAALSEKVTAMSVVAAMSSDKSHANKFQNVNKRLQQQLDLSEAALSTPSIADRPDKDHKVQTALVPTELTKDDDDDEAQRIANLWSASSSDLSEDDHSDDEQEGTNGVNKAQSTPLPSAFPVPQEINTASPKLSIKSASTILMQRAKSKLISELKAAKELALASSAEFKAQTKAVLRNASNMQKMLEALTREKNHCETELEKVKGKNSDLQDEIDQLRVDQRKLKRAADRQEATAKALALSKTKEAEWLKKAELVEKELEDLKASYSWTETFQEDYAGMKEAAAVMKEKAMTAMKENEQLRASVEAKQTELDAVSDVRRQLEESRAECEEQRRTIQRLTDENESLKLSESQINEQLGIGQTPGSSPRRPGNGSQMDYSFSSTASRSGSPYAALDKLHEVREKQQSGTRSVATLVGQLRKRSYNAEKQLAEAKAELQRKGEEIAQITTARNRLQDELNEIQERAELRYQNAVSTTKSVKSQLEASELQQQQLKKQLSQLVATSNSLRSENEKLSNESSNLSSSLRREQQSVGKANSETKAIRDQMASLKASASRTETQLQHELSHEKVILPCFFASFAVCHLSSRVCYSQAARQSAEAELEALRSRFDKADADHARLVQRTNQAIKSEHDRQVLPHQSSCLFRGEGDALFLYYFVDRVEAAASSQ